MNDISISRRFFLQTAAFASTASIAGTYPGISLAADGKTLRVRFNRDPESFDPGYYVGGHPNNDVNWLTMPALVHYGMRNGQPTWVPSPFVEHVTVRDATNIDFELKKGLMWTNGFGEVTTEDVAYSYARMTTSDWKNDYATFSHVEVTGSHTGTIVLSEPFSPFMNTTLASGTGIIVSKAATESVGGRFTTEVPASCGPYVYEMKQGQYVRLTRNPDWQGDMPYFDVIEGLIVTEDESAALAFEAGELDCAQVSSNSLARYSAELPPNSRLTVAGALQYMWLGMNTEHPKLQDIRIRKAIQRAVDQASVIAGAYSGTAEPSYGVVSPGLTGRRTSAGYSFDPEAARALVDEAGASGLELTLKTLNNQERVLSATIIQANLADIGINVTVMPVDAGPFWEMGQESKGDGWKDLELWIMRYGSGPDPYEPFQWFVRDQVGIWNWERWSSDEFEDLFAMGVMETDPSKRAEIYFRMQEIMEDTGAYVWLTHEPEVFVHRSDLSVQLAPSGEMQLTYFADV